MAGYIGTQAVSVNTTSATISDDLSVGDDLTVTDDATIGGTALVTGVLTTTAAAVFSGGFTSNDGSTISTADNTVQLTLISTDADNDSGPIMDFYRNSSSPADGDSIGVFQFIGRNDNSQDVTAIQIETKMTDVSDGDEDASFSMGIRRAGAFIDALSFDPTEVVFNDSGADVDFRVESDNQTHALFVQGSDGFVGIGTTNPLAPTAIVAKTTSYEGLELVTPTGDGSGEFHIGVHDNGGTAGRSIVFKRGGADGMDTESARIDASGLVTAANGLTLTDGNLTVAAGHGIDFSAQTASGVTGVGSSKGELLDHYEQGAFTPFFMDASGNGNQTNHSHQVGFYVRIGARVHVHGYLSSGGSFGSASGDLRIGGLPFAAVNVTNGFSSVWFGYGANLNITAGHYPAGYIPPNHPYIQVQKWSSAVGTTNFTLGELSTDGELMFGASYNAV